MGVRQAIAGDEAELREVRLRALADAPEAFGSTSERELARSTADWQRWLAPGATFLFDAESDGAGAVGLVAVVVLADEPAVRQLMAVWVDPAARGTGAADALVQSALTWARADGAARARVEVYESNGTARRLYERHGFRPTGRVSPADEGGRIGVELERPL